MSLAITEKRRQQRPSSCVGIFFQLFSKKKLFSKKLLPPAKKTAAKKFTGDDKIPMGKLLLIADENHSGYSRPDPEPESDAGCQMQAPCIVARLMGLELIPVVPHGRPRRALDSSSDAGFDGARLDNGLRSDNAGGGKAESRPQKQQKTEGSAEKVETNVFHRGLASGTRKRQQVRLGPTVKSPRLLSRSNTARLVQVANRILEPGLHSRSKAKCAIMYRSSLEGEAVSVEELSTGSLVRSCNSLVVVKEPSVGECGCSGSDFGDGPKERKELVSSVVLSGQSKNEPEENQTKLMPEENNELKLIPVLNGQVKNGSLVIQAKLNVESRICDPVQRKQEDHSNKSSIKRNGSRQNPLRLSRDEQLSGAKVCSRKHAGMELNQLHGSKDFISLNKNINNCVRSRSPIRLSGSRSPEIGKNGCEKIMGGKKRPTNSTQIGSVRAANSDSGKEKMQNDVISRRKLVNNRSLGSGCVKTPIKKLHCDDLNGSKDNGIISFTFNSPMRHDSGSLKHEGMVQRKRGQGELGRDACNRIHIQNKLTSDENFGSLFSPNVMALRGDALSSLLEEKIRELSSLDQDELASGDDLPGKSTASILQELISALTMRVPELENNGDSNNGDSASDMSVRTDISISHNQIGDVANGFQEKDLPGNVDAYLSSDANQPSPVSILEAPFSNDSCSLGSPNDSSGGKSQFGLSDICKKTLSLDSETDLADTATSSTTSQSSSKESQHSINKSSIMYVFGVSNIGVSEATETISDAEMLFESISGNWSDKSVKPSFNSFLLSTLETIMDASILNFHSEDANQLRKFLLECLIECLNAKLSHFWRSGFRTWEKHPLILSREQLMLEVHAEIRGWVDLAGKFLDDLVESDISRMNISWAECNAETFDVVLEIQSDVLKALVDEMLHDLC